MKSSPEMEEALQKFALTGQITTRTEKNPYLKVSYCGTDKGISKKWNVKIYSTGSIVTTDQKILLDIVKGIFTLPDTSLKLLQIDDAGIGFPYAGS